MSSFHYDLRQVAETEFHSLRQYFVTRHLGVAIPRSVRTCASGQVNWLTRGAEAGGHSHQIGKRIRLHFSHHLPAVRLYRDFADAQFCADLLV